MSKLGSEGKLVSDPKLLKRVDTITGRLIAQAIIMRPDTQKWEWSVQVIDEPKTVNAWCMAGGRMALYTGLIQKVDPTDDELAQVMGHEISHALANHTAERMSVAMASQLGALAVGVASDSAAGMAAAQGAAAVAITLPNSRASETEADRIGIELAAKAGYDPRAAATLWQKMAKAGGERASAVPEHPSGTGQPAGDPFCAGATDAALLSESRDHGRCINWSEQHQLPRQRARRKPCNKPRALRPPSAGGA